MESQVICAISTPPGVGGIAVARVSGEGAMALVDKLWRGKSLQQAASHTAHLGTVLDSQGQPLDQAVATVYRAPASFTGEDVVELAVHGSTYVQQALVEALIGAGARLAEPGEFTRRAFSAGKMDLAQAEAVADIIASESRAAHRIAMRQMRGRYSERLRSLRDQLLQLASLLELELDFSEEDVEFASRERLIALAREVHDEVERLAGSFHAGQAIKQGIPVAIVGATNAGKSSLLNALLGDDRAIVSDVHGTTRDVVEDTLRMGDYMFRLMDTAGLRATSDVVETMGIERSRKAAAKADIVIYVVDGTAPETLAMPQTDGTVLLAVNKIDKGKMQPVELPGVETIEISARTGQGIEALREAMVAAASRNETAHGDVLVTNARHHQALTQAAESAQRAIETLESGLSSDLVAQDLRLTIHHLSSILGDISSSDILSNIFHRFCIGK